MGSRYFQNPYAADASITGVDRSGQVSAKTKDEINRTFQKLFGVLDSKLTELSNSRDASIYTGISGYAYLYLNLSVKEDNLGLLQKANTLAELSLKRLRMKDVTFLCGDVGPLCVAAVIKKKLGEFDTARHYVSVILECLPGVMDTTNDLPNELLYGRVGYLFGLLFINKHVEPVGANILNEVAKSIITAGKPTRRGDDGPPLMWDWHGKEYLGAAHGVAGILYLLLQVKEHLSSEDLTLVKQTLDYILTIRFKSGNLPSSIGSNDDRLVHWCHGAPGFVQVLLSAAFHWKEKRYLDGAELCGEVVWQRGLLKKGYGLCHGVAGNAYTFLALYQATRRPVHLQRSLHMAHWCSTYPENLETPPDRPFSLFEGLAGTVFFLKDIQNPLESLFPAFSINPFDEVLFD